MLGIQTYIKHITTRTPVFAFNDAVLDRPLTNMGKEGMGVRWRKWIWADIKTGERWETWLRNAQKPDYVQVVALCQGVVMGFTQQIEGCWMLDHLNMGQAYYRLNQKREKEKADEGVTSSGCQGHQWATVYRTYRIMMNWSHVLYMAQLWPHGDERRFHLRPGSRSGPETRTRRRGSLAERTAWFLAHVMLHGG